MPKSAKRPNLLILMPDQWRADALSCAGHPAVRTPHVDRLAAEGVRFERAYTPCPLCMPARSSFLSGLYPHNHGQWVNEGHLPADTDTFAGRLRATGYRTAHIGKSHYYVQRRGDHLERHRGYLQALGWSDVFETTGPHATCTTDSILTDHWREAGLLDVFRDDYRRRREAGAPEATWPSPLPPGEAMDDFVGDRAEAYLEGLDGTEPFCVFVGFGGPHEPWDAPADWAARFDPAATDPAMPPDPAPDGLPPAAAAYHAELFGGGHGSSRPEMTPGQTARLRALYYAKIAHIDARIGRLLDLVRRRGWDERTAVVFWSDHGEMLGDKARLYKSCFFEGAARVPLIVRHPARTGAGRVAPGLVSLVDLFPTLLGFAGAEPKPGAFGRSLLPLLAEPDRPHHEAVFSEFDRRTMVRDARHKLVVDDAGRDLQLFDLQADPGETLNLAGRPDQREHTRRLRETLLRWLLATQAPQGPGRLPAS